MGVDSDTGREFRAGEVDCPYTRSERKKTTTATARIIVQVRDPPNHESHSGRLVVTKWPPGHMCN